MKKLLLLMTLLLCASVGLGGMTPSIAEEAATAPQVVDLDLSKMSGTFVYAEIYQMMMDPQAYIGKVIRLSGWYDVYEDSTTGMVYTSCIIPDATSSCAQGIEFVWGGEHRYPQDYPEPGADLVVTGRFETYLEDDYEYIHLADAEVVWTTEGETHQ